MNRSGQYTYGSRRGKYGQLCVLRPPEPPSSPSCDDPELKRTMFNRGKLVLVSMVLLGLGAALFAFWFRYQHGKRTIDQWGSEAVVLVRDSDLVELVALAPADEAGANSELPPPVDAPEIMTIQGKALKVLEKVDISRAPGLVHLRHALVQDASYAWDEAVGGGEDLQWRYALRFSRNEKEAEFAFDLDRRRAKLVGRERAAALSPHLARGLHTFFDDHLNRAQTAGDK